MKKIEIVLNGKQEEQIAQDIMISIYEAIQKHGYCDTHVGAVTLPTPGQELQIPEFMTRTPDERGRAERGLLRKRG